MRLRVGLWIDLVLGALMLGYTLILAVSMPFSVTALLITAVFCGLFIGLILHRLWAALTILVLSASLEAYFLVNKLVVAMQPRSTTADTWLIEVLLVSLMLSMAVRTNLTKKNDQCRSRRAVLSHDRISQSKP